MAVLKELTYRKVLYKINKYFNMSEYQEDIKRSFVEDLVLYIISEPTWALQNVSYKVGKKFKDLDKDSFIGLSQLDVAQFGAMILEALDGMFYQIKITYIPDSDIYSGALIVDKDKVRVQEVDEKSIEPRTQKTNLLDVKCSKRFWRDPKKMDIDDTLTYLANQPYKLNRDVLNYQVDDSYDKSMHKELELNRANEMYREYIDKELFFNWFIDARGRVYSEGYHINPQGTTFKKATLDVITEPVNEIVVDELVRILDI